MSSNFPSSKSFDIVVKNKKAVTGLSGHFPEHVSLDKAGDQSIGGLDKIF